MNPIPIIPIIALTVFAVIVLLLIIFFAAKQMSIFSKELKYLNSEIGRTTGDEQKEWKAKKKKLWLSIIPFVKY